ncbi:MAG: T9SS type A sorting domain-containing protein, partial [Bacteroidales bacterium]|nr:T9SS type A sorting domain-containing protein [Bacteroidales bacterium]
LQTYKGCDSIVTLNLTVNELITPTNLVLDNIANYFEFSWQGTGESYVIYRNNDSIATITGTIYQDTNVVVGTNYCYKVKALNSTCESELSEGICQIFSGLNDIKNNKISATLYPNPTDNKAILEIEGLTNQYDVIVYDLHGRTIKSYRLNLGEKKLEIDVKGFANGVYNIKIVNDKNSITKKLIVR